MTTWRIGGWTLVLILCALIVDADAQPRGPMTKGPEHAKLDALAGLWRTQALKPGTTEPAPGTGESVFEWTLGGVWLGETLTMEIPGVGTRHQLGLMTYDPRQGGYVGSWHDNLAPRVWPFAGKWIDAGTLELRGRFDIGSQSVDLVVRYSVIDREQIIMRQLQSINSAALQDVFAVDLRRMAGV